MSDREPLERRSPSGRAVVRALGNTWQLHIDGELVASGNDGRDAAGALEGQAVAHHGDAELVEELLEAADYLREDYANRPD